MTNTNTDPPTAMLDLITLRLRECVPPARGGIRQVDAAKLVALLVELQTSSCGTASAREEAARRCATEPPAMTSERRRWVKALKQGDHVTRYRVGSAPSIMTVYGIGAQREVGSYWLRADGTLRPEKNKRFSPHGAAVSWVMPLSDAEAVSRKRGEVEMRLRRALPTLTLPTLYAMLAIADADTPDLSEL